MSKPDMNAYVREHALHTFIINSLIYIYEEKIAVEIAGIALWYGVG